MKPHTVFWEITGQCNLICKHCYLGKLKKQRQSYYSLKEAFEYIDYFYEAGFQTILFTGGEPLLYSDIYDVILKTGEYGYKLHAGLLTNGSLLNREVIVKLKESGVSAIQVSIDGIGKGYSFIRGINFDIIDENIQQIKEFKIKLQAKFVLTKKNYWEFKKVWDYCQKNQISLSVSLIIGLGSADNSLILSPSRYFTLFLKMFEEKERSKWKCLMLPDFAIEEYLKTGVPETGCVAGRDICGLTHDKKFVPCIYLSNIDVKSVFGVEAPEFDKNFMKTFNQHPLFILFRKETSQSFGCPIRKRLNKRKDPFSVYEFAKWYSFKKNSRGFLV